MIITYSQMYRTDKLTQLNHLTKWLWVRPTLQSLLAHKPKCLQKKTNKKDRHRRAVQISFTKIRCHFRGIFWKWWAKFHH